MTTRDYLDCFVLDIIAIGATVLMVLIVLGVIP